ncbi:hypothetical protein BGZ57DRAFT_884425 [Hyaloscypha finlandica]|nr:hypothetical protein BGZ57DRAFT_884425 [Hyaloscypha finlandica]
MEICSYTPATSLGLGPSLNTSSTRLARLSASRTQQFGNWAFQHPPIRDVWMGVVPEETDVLLTHGPAK